MEKQVNNEGVVIVKYRITDELVNKPIPFLRAYSRIKPSEGIDAVYVDDGPKTPAKSTIRFDQAGEHTVRVLLRNSRVIPDDFLRHAEHIYSVEIPESVTEIKDMAFRWTHLPCPPALPPHLVVIGKCAFDGAYEGVDCVQVPDSVVRIGNEAFNGVPHIILGKSYREWLKYLECYDEVTIPVDNPYVEARDGFFIEKATNTVKGLKKGAFVDAEDVTIRLPEGITGIADDSIIGLFRNFSRANLYIPGSVEKVSLDTGCPFIEFAQGVKEISLKGGSPKAQRLMLPNTLERLALTHCAFEELSIPAGLVLTIDRCTFQRLTIGPGVTLVKDRFAEVFKECKGEVFVEGPIHFDAWGYMEDGSVIHVPDEAMAKRIFDSPEFNKQVKIFINGKLCAAQEEGVQDKQLLSLLGCPDYPYTLQPIKAEGGSTPRFITLLFRLPKKTTVEIDINNTSFKNSGEYILDDGERKKYRSKIALPAGLHIIRLISNWLDTCLEDRLSDKKITVEPACEAMLISDSICINQISKNLCGVKHLILGAQCHPTEFRLPVERISVVPENKALEYRDGCIIERETKRLLYAGPDSVGIPSDIAEIEFHAFNYYKQERLTIPDVKNLTLYGKPDALSQLKELVFEEGFESISLSGFALQPDAVVTFPKSLKELEVINVAAGQMNVPSACNVVKFSGSHIGKLEFFEDVTLRPSYGTVFKEFSGHIHFHKGVTPVENIGAPNDDCVITVSDNKLANAIKKDDAFNKNVKVEVKK